MWCPPSSEYLAQGGFLISLPNGPFPFYYDTVSDKAAPVADRVGLPVKQGWELPPDGAQLTFQFNTNVLLDFPAKARFPSNGDLRWRPAVRNATNPGDIYVPLAWLTDANGRSYGDGMAYIEHRTSPLQGGRSHRDRPGDPGIPQARADGAEGRARGASGEEGDGRSKSPPRHLDRQEVHQPRPAVPRPDSGRQHRPDEGGRQVRIPPRLQVLDLRHLVNSPGDHPLDRRPGAHDPHSRPHDRDDQQDRPHQPADAARDRPRADARRAQRKARHVVPLQTGIRTNPAWLGTCCVLP